MERLAQRELRGLVDRFVRQWHTKAVDLLVRCCEDDAILHEIMTDLAVQQQEPSPQDTYNRSSGLNLTIGRLGQSRPPSSRDSRASLSPPPRHTPRRRASSNARPFAPLSPPSTRTTSSVISYTPKEEGGSGEYIFLIIITERSVEEKAARMRNAPIKHSVMREEVARRHNIATSRAEEYTLSVPHNAAPHAHIPVPVSECVTLQWRRPQSNTTHNTTFYIVPKNVLDIDILLGYEDSGEDAPVYSPPMYPPPTTPHLQHGRGFGFEEYDPNKHPTAPTPPLARSFHRSSLTYECSRPTTPMQQQHLVHQFVENLANRHHPSAHAHGAAVETSRLSQHSPAGIAPGSPTSHIEHPQPIRPSVATSASGRNVDQNIITNKVRLNLEWDALRFNLWLDLCAPGEVFFEAFQQVVQKQKGVSFDRSMVTIYLKKNRHTPNDEVYVVSLGKDDLRADWETTVEWLEENKSGDPPRVHGRVESGEG